MIATCNRRVAGEKSFAEILSRYDRENPLVERDLVVHGMRLALAGWMAIVPGNASKGFRKLLAGTNHE